MEVVAGDPYRTVQVRLTIKGANLVAPSLGRGERRELVVGDQVVLTGTHRAELFYGDVWLERV